MIARHSNSRDVRRIARNIPAFGMSVAHGWPMDPAILMPGTRLEEGLPQFSVAKDLFLGEYLDDVRPLLSVVCQYLEMPGTDVRPLSPDNVEAKRTQAAANIGSETR